MKINNFQPIKGGTNALILRADFYGKDTVIKQYGFERKNNSKAPRIKKDTLEILYGDAIRLRQTVKSSGIIIPNIINHFYARDDCLYNEIDSDSVTDDDTFVRLIIVEEYSGISFRELILSRSLSPSQVTRDAELIEGLINIMPLNVELDTIPPNFTFLNDKIFFVDFMPPKIVEYRNNMQLRDLFPGIAERIKEREERRIRRYTTTSGRLERFNIYLREILNKIT